MIADSARTKRLRRLAQRHGYQLSKSRVRDRESPEFNTWTLGNIRTRKAVAGLELDNIELHLNRMENRDTDDGLTDAYAAAFHEAGHAVMGLHLGFNVGRVAILPFRELLGHTEFPDWQDERRTDRERALVAVAGIAAVMLRILDLPDLRERVLIGTGGDQADIADLGYGDQGDTLLREACQILRGLKPVVLWIASRLVDEDLLTDTELADVWSRRDKPPSPLIDDLLEVWPA